MSDTVIIVLIVTIAVLAIIFLVLQRFPSLSSFTMKGRHRDAEVEIGMTNTPAAPASGAADAPSPPPASTTITAGDGAIVSGGDAWGNTVTNTFGERR